MLQRMEEYLLHARKLQSRGIPREALDVLFGEGFVDRSAMGDPDKLDALVKALTDARLRARAPDDRRRDRNADRPVLRRRQRHRQEGHRQQRAAFDITNIRQMAKSYEQLSAFGLPPYTLKHGDDRTSSSPSTI